MRNACWSKDQAEGNCLEHFSEPSVGLRLAGVTPTDAVSDRKLLAEPHGGQSPLAAPLSIKKGKSSRLSPET